MKLKYFILAIFILSILFFSAQDIYAEIQTITQTIRQPFAGSQSPDDARIAAIHRVKREVLEMAGTYIESLTIVKNSVIEKDEITALAAGILKAEIISEPQPYVEGRSFGIEVVAKVDVDTGILEARVSKLLKDKTLLGKLKESQERERQLLERIQTLEEKNVHLTSATANAQKEELRKEFRRASAGLNAVELNQKALSLWDHGFYTDVPQALRYLEQAIAIDPEYGDAYNNIGLAHDNQGEYDRAIGYYKKALEVGLKKLGPDHPAVATYYNNIGAAYAHKGEYDQAIGYFKAALEIGLKKLGPDHPQVAAYYDNIGAAHAHKEEYNRAIDYFKKALEICMKTLGPDHPCIKKYNEHLDAVRGE
jgi:tetratricopeptide (TPR) repeat protein